MAALLSLHVQLHTLEGGQFEGTCTDVEFSEDGVLALVEFSSDQAPALCLGEKTKLTFRGASTVEADACTVLRTDQQAQRHYSFRLEKVSNQMLRLLADRRGSVRHRPSASRPVRVRVLDVPVEVGVHDISATGLSILVEPPLEKELVNQVRLRLSIMLPEKGSIEVAAMIRHRRLFGSAILYGLEFDGQLPDFMRAQGRLLSYLTSLQSTGS